MAKEDWPDWEIYVRDGCHCVYCGFDGTTLQGWRQLQIDHRIPVAKVGTNEPTNKVVACTDCNRKKHSFDPSSGNPSRLSSEAGRQELIKESKDYIKKKQGREVEDFDLMMKELQTKRFNHKAEKR